MKAVVVEIKNKDMIIMDQSGCFHKMKYDNVSKIGEEILFTNKKMNNLSYFRKLTAIAAMFLLVIGSGYGTMSYYTPYAYVDVDINPSLELVLNRYLKVLEVQELNIDAKKIAPDKSKFQNKDIQEVINALIENAEKQKILSSDKDNDILFTVSSKNEKLIGDINQKLESTSKKKLEKLNNKYEIMLEKVALNKHESAKKQKVSPGRIVLYEKLKEVKPDARLEDVVNSPVRNTMKLIKEYRKASKERKDDVDNIKNETQKEIKNNKPERDRIQIKKNKTNKFKNKKPELRSKIESKKESQREINKIINKENRNKQRRVNSENINKNISGKINNQDLAENEEDGLNIPDNINKSKNKQQDIKKDKEHLRSGIDYNNEID